MLILRGLISIICESGGQDPEFYQPFLILADSHPKVSFCPGQETLSSPS